MHYFPRFLLLGVGLVIAASLVVAQPGDRQPPQGTDAYVARLMAFDKNKDNKLTKDEITDARLTRLFDRADTNKDGVVTKEELTALATQEAAIGGGPGGLGGPGGPDGGKGGFGKEGGFGKGGFGKDGGFGKGGFGKEGGFGKGGFPGFGRPQPGVLMPAPLQEQLKLTAEQKTQLEKLQKEVEGKLEKLLTEEQRQTLKELKEGPRRP